MKKRADLIYCSYALFQFNKFRFFFFHFLCLQILYFHRGLQDWKYNSKKINQKDQISCKLFFLMNYLSVFIKKKAANFERPSLFFNKKIILLNSGFYTGSFFSFFNSASRLRITLRVPSRNAEKAGAI